MLNHHLEQTPQSFLKSSLESYNSSRDILLKRHGKGQNQKPIRAVTKQSSISLKLESHQDTILITKTPRHERMKSDEYQEYLQGSLQKYMKSFNMK